MIENFFGELRYENADKNFVNGSTNDSKRDGLC